MAQYYTPRIITPLMPFNSDTVGRSSILSKLSLPNRITTGIKPNIFNRFSDTLSNINLGIDKINPYLQAATTLAGIYGDSSQIKDTSAYDATLNDLQNTSFGPASTTSDLLSNYSSIQTVANPTSKTFQLSGGKKASNVLKGAAAGAVAGSVIPGIGNAVGAVGGAVAGALTSLAGAISGNNKAKRKAAKISDDLSLAGMTALNNAFNTVSNYNKDVNRNLNMNYLAFGGPFDSSIPFITGPVSYGLYMDSLNLQKDKINSQSIKSLPTSSNIFDDGGIVTTIDNGGTHEANPYGGVPVGVDNSGIPNLVEEGEVIYNDYVFSNRLKVPKALKLKHHLVGDTYAEAFNNAKKEYSERPNDPISKNGINAIADILSISQDEVRAKEEAKQEKALMDYLEDHPEEAELLENNIAQQQAIEAQTAQQQQVDSNMIAQDNMPIQENIPQPMQYACGGKKLACGGKKLAGGTGDKNKSYVEYLEEQSPEYPILEIMDPNIITQDIRPEWRDLYPGTQRGIINLLKEHPERAYQYKDILKERLAEEIQSTRQQQEATTLNSIPEYTIPEIGINTSRSIPKYTTPNIEVNASRSIPDYTIPETIITSDNNSTVNNIPNYLRSQDWWRYNPSFGTTTTAESINTGNNNSTPRPQNITSSRSTDVSTAAPVIVRNTELETPILNGIEAPTLNDIGLPAVSVFDRSTSIPVRDIINRDTKGSTTATQPSNRRFDTRYITPIANAGMVLSDVFGLTNTPESYNFISRPQSIGYSPIGGYLAYKPYDTRYDVNQRLAMANATRRNLSNTTSPAAAANILINDYNTNNAIGDIYRNAEELNDKRRYETATYNNSIDTRNADNSLRAQIANAENRRAYENALLTQAQYTNSRNDAAYANRAANLSNLITSLDNISRDNLARQQGQAYIDSGIAGVLNDAYRNLYNTMYGIPTTAACGGKLSKSKKRK